MVDSNWCCSGFYNGEECENEGTYIITKEGNEYGSWNAKTARCEECLQRQFPGGEGLSYLEATVNYNNSVPFFATNNVQEAWQRLFGNIYKTTDYPFHAQV